MGNSSPSRGRTARIKARWHRLVSRREARRFDNAAIDAAIQAFQAADRPPPEPPPTHDSETFSVHTTYPEDLDEDSIFGIPPLAARCYYSSSDSSLDGSDYFTGSDGSEFLSAGDTSLLSDSPSVHSTYSIDSLGPPPPGSLMDYWDKPIPPSCLHNFASHLEDLKCHFTDGHDSHSLSSIEYDNSDDDTYFADNPISSRHVQHLTNIHLEPQVAFSPLVATASVSCELVDSGGIFNMTNRLDALLNVVAIKPFSIGMAAQESHSSSFCTHCGDFPIRMCDGSIFYTPMFYNAKASETILSPESICFHSNGVITHWTQSGSTTADNGSVSFFDSNGAEVIAMSLAKRNGLYYTTISAVGVDSIDPSLKPSANHTIYYHSHHPDTCDDISIETTCTPPSFPVTYESHQTPQPRINQFASTPPRTPPFSVPTPKCGNVPPLIDDYVPKCKQIETDLWQARLGHCSDWQLKVLPMSADGLPSRFHPHPFASYDHYNQGRVRKRAATRGKHPSRATDKRQRWLMDFGFLRASTTDFSRPDKSRDRVVTSFVGYNAYLIIVDEYTKYVWVYLCVSKDPPIALIELHLDQFGTRGIHIRCDQGGELAGCHDFITAMAARGHIVEPTGADSPDQNKGAEKWIWCHCSSVVIWLRFPGHVLVRCSLACCVLAQSSGTQVDTDDPI
jgi:hypothetical protein